MSNVQRPPGGPQQPPQQGGEQRRQRLPGGGQQGPRGAQQGAKQGAQPAAPARSVALPGALGQRQRGGVRAGLLLLGLVLIAVSGGAFWYILRELDVREEYLVTATTLERWDSAGVADFTVVEANLGAAQGVPPEFLDLFIGRRAIGRIPAGTVVSAGMFEDAPLSNEGESDKVLIQVSLPAGEAPGGTLDPGDRVAMFGAEYSLEDTVEVPVGLIGVLEVKDVDGDTLTYLVTADEAIAIQDIVDRYSLASKRRMWKLGADITAAQLVPLFEQAASAAAFESAFQDALDDILTDIEDFDEAPNPNPNQGDMPVLDEVPAQ